MKLNNFKYMTGGIPYAEALESAEKLVRVLASPKFKDDSNKDGSKGFSCSKNREMNSNSSYWVQQRALARGNKW